MRVFSYLLYIHTNTDIINIFSYCTVIAFLILIVDNRLKSGVLDRKSQKGQKQNPKTPNITNKTN